MIINESPAFYHNGWKYTQWRGKKFSKKKATDSDTVEPTPISKDEYYKAYNEYNRGVPRTLRDQSTTNRHSDFKGYMDRRPYEPKE